MSTAEVVSTLPPCPAIYTAYPTTTITLEHESDYTELTSIATSSPIGITGTQAQSTAGLSVLTESPQPSTAVPLTGASQLSTLGSISTEFIVTESTPCIPISFAGELAQRNIQAQHDRPRLNPHGKFNSSTASKLKNQKVIPQDFVTYNKTKAKDLKISTNIKSKIEDDYYPCQGNINFFVDQSPHFNSTFEAQIGFLKNQIFTEPWNHLERLSIFGYANYTSSSAIFNSTSTVNNVENFLNSLYLMGSGGSSLSYALLTAINSAKSGSYIVFTSANNTSDIQNASQFSKTLQTRGKLSFVLMEYANETIIGNLSPNLIYFNLYNQSGLQNSSNIMGLLMDAYDCCPMSTMPPPTTETSQPPTTTPKPITSTPLLPTTPQSDNPNINCNHATGFTGLYCNITHENGTGVNLTSSNVGEIANMTLNYLNTTNTTSVFMATTILSNLTDVKNVTKNDFFLISHLTDTILNADADTFKVDFNFYGSSTTQSILRSIDNLLTNAEPNSCYKNGTNIGLCKQSFDCSTTVNSGFADNGETFITNTEGGNYVASIQILSDGCNSNISISAHYAIYRDMKLFQAINVPSNQPSATTTAPKERLSITSSLNSHFASYFNFYAKNSDTTSGNETISSTPSFETTSSGSSSSSEALYDPNDLQDRCYLGFLTQNQAVLSARPYNNNGENGNMDMNNLKVKIAYRKDMIAKPLHGQVKITTWNNINGGWSKHTCDVEESDTQWSSTCHSGSQYAVVTDGRETDPSLCSTTLVLIAYIVNGGSLIAVIGINIILIVRRIKTWRSSKKENNTNINSIEENSAGSDSGSNNRRSRDREYEEKEENKITLFVYNSLLIIFYLVYTFFHDHKYAGTWFCHTVAIVTYWLLLLCVFIKMFQAFELLDPFVYGSCLERPYKRLISWPVSLNISLFAATSIVASFIISIPDFFKRNDNFCWIRSDYIIPGVVLPMCFILADFIMFWFLICACMIQPDFERLDRRQRGRKNKIDGKKTFNQIKKRLIGGGITQIVVALPWILQYLSLYSSGPTIWHTLFIILNGSRGVIQLLLLTVIKYFTEKDKKDEQTKQNINRPIQKRGSLKKSLDELPLDLRRRSEIPDPSAPELRQPTASESSHDEVRVQSQQVISELKDEPILEVAEVYEPKSDTSDVDETTIEVPQEGHEESGPPDTKPSSPEIKNHEVSTDDLGHIYDEVPLYQTEITPQASHTLIPQTKRKSMVMYDGIYQLGEELQPPSGSRNAEVLYEMPTSNNGDMHKDNLESSHPPAVQELSNNLRQAERWLENRPEASEARLYVEENGFENVKPYDEKILF